MAMRTNWTQQLAQLAITGKVSASPAIESFSLKNGFGILESDALLSLTAPAAKISSSGALEQYAFRDRMKVFSVGSVQGTTRLSSRPSLHGAQELTMQEPLIRTFRSRR
jgi:hypothetical protein